MKPPLCIHERGGRFVILDSKTRTYLVEPVASYVRIVTFPTKELAKSFVEARRS